MNATTTKKRGRPRLGANKRVLVNFKLRPATIRRLKDTAKLHKSSMTSVLERALEMELYPRIIVTQLIGKDD